MSYEIYIGPALVATNLIREVTKQIPFCTNGHKSIQIKDKFCNECGSQVQFSDHKYKEKYKADFDSELIYTAVNSSEILYFIPSQIFYRDYLYSSGEEVRDINKIIDKIDYNIIEVMNKDLIAMKIFYKDAVLKNIVYTNIERDYD